MTRQDLLALIRILRLELLAEGFLLFGLGAAIARFLGQPAPSTTYLLGQGIVTGLQAGTHLLVSFYAHSGDRLDPERMLIQPDDPESETSIPLRWILMSSAGLFTLVAMAASLLLIAGRLEFLSAAILIGGVIGLVAYTIPPFRIRRGGYGEVIAALLLGAGIPAFSFTLHTGELHRLIPMSTAPIVASLFASILVLELPSYAQDVKANRRNLMVQIGWRSAMRVHDVTLALAFFVLGMGFLLGLPRRVALGTLLTLPLAAAQVWYLYRLRGGAPARWGILRISSASLVGLISYLEMAGYLLS